MDDYSLKNIRSDASSAMVVFFIALPLCLGIALASGVPLMSGILAGLVGGLVVSFLSGSRFAVSGPAAGLTVLVYAGVQKLGLPAFFAAVFLAGLFQILFGFLKAGTIAYYFPNSVIKGMLTAIGIILILKQIPHALGYDADFEGDFAFWQYDSENSFSELLKAVIEVEPAAMLISIFSLLILLYWKKLVPGKAANFPPAVIVVVLGILFNEILDRLDSPYHLSYSHFPISLSLTIYLILLYYRWLLRLQLLLPSKLFFVWRQWISWIRKKEHQTSTPN
jgi:MFS superfamily sulfate permease-like transporter